MEYVLEIECTDFDVLDRMHVLGDMRVYRLAAVQVFHRVWELIEQTFTVEGHPPWPPLTLSTIFERLMLDFNEGPILFRTGSLLASYIDPNHPDNASGMGSTPDEVVMVIGSSDYRAYDLAMGDPASNLPARSPFPDDTLLFAALEETLVGAMEDTLDLLEDLAY